MLHRRKVDTAPGESTTSHIRPQIPQLRPTMLSDERSSHVRIRIAESGLRRGDATVHRHGTGPPLHRTRRVTRHTFGRSEAVDPRTGGIDAGMGAPGN